LSTDDQDAGDTHVFSLLKGDGTNDDGNNLVKISGNELLLTKQVAELSKANWNILIKVTDKMNESVEKSLTLTQSSNHSPTFSSKPVTYVMQDEVYAYKIYAADVDGDLVSFSCENLPGWLTFYPELGLLTGNPGNSDVGTYNFTVFASDTKTSVSQKITLMVLNVNDAPTIKYIVSNQTFITNKENQFIIPADCFTDIDAGDKLSYSIGMSNNSALPSWLSFDPTTRILNGNPPKEAFGSYSLKLIAMDQKSVKESMIFTLNVTFPTAAIGLDDSNFNVFPNPVIDVVSLIVPENFGGGKLEVANAKGAIVRTIKIPEGGCQQLNLSDLSSGIYILSLQNNNARLVKKIVKK